MKRINAISLFMKSLIITSLLILIFVPAVNSTINSDEEITERSQINKDSYRSQINKESDSIASQTMPQSFSKKSTSFFIKNNGQLKDPSIKYYFKTNSFSIGFTSSDTVIKVLENDHIERVFRISFIDASFQEPKGVNALSHRLNYFYGPDPNKWVTDVTSYSCIVYSNLYPGIDLIYKFDKDNLKYEFHVSPFANPDVIEMKYHGIDSLTVENKKIIALTGSTVIEDSDLLVYQSNPYSIIETSFISKENNSYGFEIERYDRTKKLIIDPILYSTFIGGAEDDEVKGSDIDPDGNCYLTGVTSSTDFPTTIGAFDTGDSPNLDTFIMKLSNDGSSLIYSTYIGGNSYERGYSIRVDNSGNAYVCGMTHSSNFPTTEGVFQTSKYSYYEDSFVLKLNPTGDVLLYSTFLGGEVDDYGNTIDIDNSGSVYVLGSTRSAQFPITNGTYDTTHNGNYDCFITKLSPNGSNLVYSTFLGGSGYDDAREITVRNGCAYLLGCTQNSSFPTTVGAFDTTFNGKKDIFVAKLNDNGSILDFSTFLGGESNENAYGITVDDSGCTYVTGQTSGADLPTTEGTFKPSATEGVFVTKINKNGTSLIYSTYIAEGGAYGIEVDQRGNVYVCGGTSDETFPITEDAYDPVYRGEGDVFLFKLNSNGSDILYSTFIGSNVFTVNNPVHSMSLPTIAYPNGGENISGTVTVSWLAATDSFGHTITYSLYYSFDNGALWNSLASQLTSTSYSWNTVSFANGGNYRIKIVAICSEGLTSEDTSNGAFSIYNIVSTSGTESTTAGNSTTTSNRPTFSSPGWTFSIILSSLLGIVPIILWKRRYVRK